MLFDPPLPRGHRQWNWLKKFAQEVTADGLPKELAPQCAGLLVVHHQCVHDQLPGDAKRVLQAIDLSGIPDASKAQRSPGDRDRYPSYCVVHNLVPTQNGNRIGPRITIDFDAQYLLVGSIRR